MVLGDKIAREYSWGPSALLILLDLETPALSLLLMNCQHRMH